MPFPRRSCPKCARSIAVNGNGALRSHFCPHWNLCESGKCVDCITARADASAQPQGGEPRHTPRVGVSA